MRRRETPNTGSPLAVKGPLRVIGAVGVPKKGNRNWNGNEIQENDRLSTLQELDDEGTGSQSEKTGKNGVKMRGDQQTTVNDFFQRSVATNEKFEEMEQQLREKKERDKIRERQLEVNGKYRPNRVHRQGENGILEERAVLISQNLRGFRDAEGNMANWLSSWRRQLLGSSVDIVLVQETRLTSIGRIKDLQRPWLNIWGFKDTEQKDQFSFWTVQKDRHAGVGILVNPYTTLGKPVVICPEFQTERNIAIEIGSIRVINIYAPNRKLDREIFFNSLRKYSANATEHWIFGGDFNSVQLPAIDRASSNREATTHMQVSDGLEFLINEWNMIDGVFLTCELPDM